MNDNFRGTLLRHLTALFIITELLIFLGVALLAPINGPDISNLTATAEGIVVGGFVGIIASVITSLYQTEATKQASRSAQDATTAGTNAAMSTPTPSNGSTITTSEPVSVEGASAPIPGSDMPPQGDNSGTRT